MVEPQNFEIINAKIDTLFVLERSKPDFLHSAHLKFSWSNWGFGIEGLRATAERLMKYGISFIELHGNRYGKDLGYEASEVRKIFSDYGITVAGICGMFSQECDLSAPSGIVRQNAVDYIRRQIDLCVDTGGSYLLIVPGAVGRPNPYDASEFHRSVETLSLVKQDFERSGVRGAVEPIRSAEVSFVHTFEEAKKYINAVDSRMIRYINGDVYHMLSEESHIPEAIYNARDYLVNLHLADSNRGALGGGCLDIDRIIKALYLIGYQNGNCYVTPEPLGPGGNPYPAMHGIANTDELDTLVRDTVTYFRNRERIVKESC
jgi:D-psicose/D-tagatose/L-ribulose 3-epimerase